MFKALLISIVIMPILLGVIAAKGRADGRDRTVLRGWWILYTCVWIGLLYLLRYRWVT